MNTDINGVIYTEGGRTYPNLDCWGLVLHLHENRSLPKFDGVCYSKSRNCAIESMEYIVENLLEPCSIINSEIVVVRFSRGKYKGRVMHFMPICGEKVIDLSSGGVMVCNLQVFIDKFQSDHSYMRFKV